MAYSDLMLWLACAAAVLIAVYVTGYLIFLFQKHVLAPDKALMCCLISGFVRKKDIQDIIRRGADPDFDNGLPLLTAVRGTVREQAIRGLIECGAGVNIVYPNGSSPLFHAVLSGNTKAVECLAAAGDAVAVVATAKGFPVEIEDFTRRVKVGGRAGNESENPVRKSL